MKALMQFWPPLAERLNQRTTRERAMVLLVLLALVWGLFDAFWFRQHQQSLQVLQANNQATEKQLADLKAKVQLQQIQVQADVDAPARQRKQQLQDELAAQQRQLFEAGQEMLSAESVPTLLSNMLQARSGLETLSLKNLRAEPLAATPAPAAPQAGTDKADAPNTTVLWRHPVELKVKGSYADIVAYLQQLEALKPRLHWQALSLVSDTEPGHAYSITATIVVTTLSLESQWLAL